MAIISAYDVGKKRIIYQNDREKISAYDVRSGGCSLWGRETVAAIEMEVVLGRSCKKYVSPTQEPS